MERLNITYLGSGYSCDKIIESGFYEISKAVGAPEADSDWLVLMLRSPRSTPNDIEAIQLAYNKTTGAQWTRSCDVSTWTTWIQSGAGGEGAPTDLSNYYTKTEVDAAFQPIGAYLDAADLTPYLTSADAATTYQPIGEYLVAADLTPYLTSADAAATYQPIGGGREELTGNRTYYVRADGSDSNDGLSDTAGGAFATIQKAIDTASALDISIYDVTIQIGTGTYTITTDIVCKSAVGTGAINITGDETTPANVTVTSSVGGLVSLFSVKNHKTTYRFRGLKLTSASFGVHGILAAAGAYVEYGKMDFGALTGGTSQQLRVEDNGLIKCIDSYTISGGAGSHWTTNGGGGLRCQFMTITLVGTPDFSGLAFANSQYLSQMIVNTNTFVGAATGKRYAVNENSLIKTNGAGETYLPGNAAGTIATQGLYV